MKNSLFGGDDAVEIATPVIPESESWSTIEKLNRERDLVGIYISARTLDENVFIMKAICNTRSPELSDMDNFKGKQDVSLGGIVTAVRSAFTKQGKPCGFVTIEDFEGSGELALFGEEWGQWKGMLIEGSTLMVKASVVQRYKWKDDLALKITDIQYLQTVKDDNIEKLTITFDADRMDDTIVSDLVSILKDSPGTTDLYFNIMDGKSNRPLTMRSGNMKISIGKELISFIKDTDGFDYKVN